MDPACRCVSIAGTTVACCEGGLGKLVGALVGSAMVWMGRELEFS